jgi:hypothetical protein
MKIVRIVLAVVSLAVTVISAAILVLDQIQWSGELDGVSPSLTFLGWFWGIGDLPPAILPLLLLLAGVTGLYFATRSGR